MEKTYHFMAGLPRSGSTVLSALLNQHPDVYASPQTDLLTMMYAIQSQVFGYQSFQAGLMHDSYENVLHNMGDSFYSQVKKPVIIDKNRSWGTPYNFLNIRPYLNANGKIIVTLRPILEVLASLIKAELESKKVTKNDIFLDHTLWATDYRDLADAKVGFLMRTNGEIENAIYSIANLAKNHKKQTCFIWYDDLLNYPNETLTKIYDFLEVKPFTNALTDIVEVDKHDDLSGYGIIDLHKIRPNLKKSDIEIDHYLSSYSIKKYGQELDFLGF
jgi:sulfotransferase